MVTSESSDKAEKVAVTLEENIANGNIVEWSLPHDPENPLQWPRSRKIGTLLIVSTGGLISFLGSSMLSPAVDLVLADFHETNITLGVFAVSVYLLGLALGPLVLSGISEVYGRAIVFNVCNVLFLIFSIATAVPTSLGMLIAFRLLMGLAASAPVTVGGGTIADVFVPAERGRATSIYALGPIIGPVLAPIAGGYLAEAKGWRWVNWLTVILAGFLTILTFTCFRETYHPVLLERKTRRLRKETNNQSLESKLARKTTLGRAMRFALIRPLKMLFRSPVVLLPCLALALIIGYLFLLFSTMATVFQQQYGFSEGLSGLVYIGIGVGNLLGTYLFAISSDRAVKKASERGTLKPEVRLVPVSFGGPLVCIGFIWYGWTIHQRTHWILPIIGTGIFGVGVMAFVMPITTYLIDVWKWHAASAIGANNFSRSILGAVIPLVAFKLYDRLGLGWGNSLLAFISLITAPLPWLFTKYGEYLRTRFPLEL
ncbi:MFS general substrate transporter [Viridothelium virens]|uniref:MFS general substrate transporter n=1 Tax=Viridothelium virens TaxID=1048519 RepID=A0A6A6HAA1_VIRVR|nr:MFS general substrate transporter [Viridothelium virens]